MDEGREGRTVLRVQEIEGHSELRTRKSYRCLLLCCTSPVDALSRWKNVRLMEVVVQCIDRDAEAEAEVEAEATESRPATARTARPLPRASLPRADLFLFLPIHSSLLSRVQ